MELFRHSTQIQTRWASFENPTGAKGNGGRANAGWKGAASAVLKSGEAVTLASIQGSGIIRRIWMTISDRSPAVLRSLRVDCYWDGAKMPAVSAPLGDFFGVGLGRQIPFESELFASPEGRSFVSFVPMPFYAGAKIIMTNESSVDLSGVFYDVNFTLEPLPADAMYLHAIFRRENPTVLGRDFELLPRVTGHGRYLGANIGVIADSAYGGTWWGEGEIKCFLDSDGQYPTLCGTGTEDYVSTAYGQGRFSQRYHGSPIADGENKQWAFYRYHIPDPVMFQTDCRVTLQQIGGAGRDGVSDLINKRVPLEPLSIQTGVEADFLKDPSRRLELAKVSEKAWINFQRCDDVSATAYFYLDRPENGLPSLPTVAQRIIGLLQPKQGGNG